MTQIGYIHDTTAPLTAALTFVCKADEWAEEATTARGMDDHSTAGRHREQERACLRRAEILALVAQTHALDSIADSLRMIALSR